MSSDPPPPYPGGPSAPLIEEKDGSPFPAGRVSPAMMQPPLDVGPPPYEPLPPQPGFIPPPMSAEGTMPYMPPPECKKTHTTSTTCFVALSLPSSCPP
ncbi:hypothetical protein JD844_020142 [Phrynosoma platyrhinos]|uniref:Uncharacterized protein n=1 Tax=Phrynosoma platyrhinos TaxID=52577 RepID=A0ABQ7TQX1_PHRPL|nr:hypothetical protein JD844_020142 [Phrynosoma platyrhinos]